MAVKKETTKAAPSLKKRVAAKKTNAKENAEVTVLNPTELAIKTIVEAIQDKKEKMYAHWTLPV